MEYTFPFGQKLHPLVQEDQSPKKIFVLGVYASAVHARWKKDGRVISQALAVASEPRIFWDGNLSEAREIIGRINIPPALGYLEPAGSQLNGPSAKVLDELILAPLGFSRQDAWLCDMLPEARLNPNQIKVIRQRYDPLIGQYGLPAVTVPERPATAKANSFCNEKRCKEILSEIETSQANTIVLLGDLPIKQFLRKVSQVDFDSLQSYADQYGYAQPTDICIGGRNYSLIPVAHPRQIGALGTHCEKWFVMHQNWVREQTAAIKR